MSELISVIIPIYKVEPYLAKCVESVLGQTYSDFEIILVDDGSPDRCGVLCDEYAQADSRIKVIHKRNGGLSDARNAGMKIAHGEYLAFIDSDDWIERDYFDILYRLLKDYDADLSAIALCNVNEEGNEIGRSHNGETHLLDATAAMENMFHRDGLPWCAQAKLYKRTLFEGIEYPVGVLMEDKATTYKVFGKCQKIVYSDLSLYKYLVRQGSIMRSQFSEKRMRSFAIQEELNSFLEQNYPVAAVAAHAYTVKVAVSMLCMMSAAKYKDMEQSEKLFGYMAKFKKEFLRASFIDKRFKTVGRVIYVLRRLWGRKIYDSIFYKKMCSKAAAVIAAK